MIGRRRAGSPSRAGRPLGGTRDTVVRFPGRSARERATRRWIAAGAVLAGLLALAWAVFLSPLLAVDRLQVTGTRLVDAAEVERRLQPLVGTPLPRIGADRVESLLADLPGLASAEEVARLPTGLEVRIEELAPVARAGTGDRVDVLLEDGSVLPEVSAEALSGALPADAEAPLVEEGLLGAGPDVRASAAGVLRELPEALSARVRGVGAESPEQVRLELDDGLVLVWGDTSQPTRKAAVAEAFLAEREAEDSTRLHAVTEVDVSVPERPVTR